MGEAKARGTIEGYLTKREQVTLGMVAITFGRPQQPKPGAEAADNTAIRKQKSKALEQLGVAWVPEQYETRAADPAFKDKLAFDPKQTTTEKVAFAIDKDVLAWVIDELTRVPAGSGQDSVLATIEERLVDMKRGDFKMPPELQANAESANGMVVGRTPDGTPILSAAV